MAFQRLTHHSVNSQAGVVFEIRKKEQEHWYEGLRQAELFVTQKELALEELYFKQREQEREQRKQQRRIDALNRIDQLTPDQEDELEALKDALKMAKLRREHMEGPIEDALMELNAAQAECARIVSEHPEILEMSYEQKQYAFTQESLTNRLARYVAGRTWGIQAGVGQEVGATIFELPEGMRQDVLEREIQLRSQVDVIASRLQAETVLAMVPPDQQQAVLVRAAHLVLEAAVEEPHGI